MGGVERSSMIAAVVLAMAFVMPTALAGADVQIGPATVLVVDSHDRDCTTLGVRACVFKFEQEGDPGDWRLSLTQNITYAGVALETPGSIMQVHILELLPDQGIYVDGSNIVIRHHVLRDAYQVHAAAPNPTNGTFDVKPDPTGISFEMPLISSKDPEKGVHKGTYRIGYFPNRYDQVVMAYDFDASTDRYVWTMLGPCDFDSKFCRDELNDTYAAYLEATPEIRYGAKVGAYQLATSAESLAPGLAGGDRLTAAAIPTARPPAAEQPRLHTNHEATDNSLPTAGRPSTAVPVPDDSTAAPPFPGPRPESQIFGAPISRPNLLAEAAPYLLAGALLAVIGAALYARITGRTEALGHPMRRRLVALIKAEPALSPTDAAERLGISRNTLMHHVRILMRAHLVRAERRERRTFLFTVDGAESTPSVICRLAGDDPVVNLLAAAEGGLTRAEVHERLPSMPTRTRNHRLRRLIERGVLQQEGAGREARFDLRPEVREHLSGGA